MGKKKCTKKVKREREKGKVFLWGETNNVLDSHTIRTTKKCVFK
jgi:hypothetical protein